MSVFSVTKEHDLFGSTVVSNAFITDHMPSAPDNAVKVYLYGLMLNSDPGSDAADMETALGLSPEQILDAFRYLEKEGLVRIIDSGNIIIQYLCVNKPASVPSVRGRYAELVGKLQTVLGTRNLSGAELQKIFDWIDIFKFEPDAAVEIVRHCVEIKGSRVNINYMDAVAKRLAAERFLSLEDVSECFRIEADAMTGAAAILKRWRLSRRPTEDELEMYSKWINEWGFTDESIEYACKEVVGSDRPTFKYLDAVLSNYHESGTVSAEKMIEISHEQDVIAEITRRIYVIAGLSNRNPGSAQRQQVEIWYKDWKMSPELMFYAAEVASASVHPFAETKKLLGKWHSEGISGVSAAKDYIGRMNYHSKTTGKSTAKKAVNKALKYDQRSYSMDELKKLGIDFGEDVYED